MKESPEYSEDRLPFDVVEEKLAADSGLEADVYHAKVKEQGGDIRDIALKETRSIELADEKEMQKMKSIYDFMKSDPEFGKFVIETGFVKAQRSEDDPARAYLVQKMVPGKRIDEISDQELYSDKGLVEELLDFVKGAAHMLEKTKETPEHIPDFYADREKFLGNFLHNPRYSGNVLIADREAKLPHRVYFVDTGSVFGPGHDKGIRKKMTQTIDRKLQLVQLKRWEHKLEGYL